MMTSENIDSNFLVNIGELAKPATTLIEKISDAVEGIAKPWHIKRVAKAESEAELIRAESKIKITELEERALNRMLKDEAKKQKNIEDVTEAALPMLKSDAKSDQVSSDWIAHFFDRSKIVSDKDMQRIWASMLANEANIPGSFSRKTINLVSALGKKDAELFTKFSSCAWITGEITPMVLDINNLNVDGENLSFSHMEHLDSIGLIRIETSFGLQKTKISGDMCVFYYGKSVILQFSDKVNSMKIGHALFTQSGKELIKICGSVPDQKHCHSMLEHWSEQGLSPFEPQSSISSNKDFWYNKDYNT